MTHKTATSAALPDPRTSVVDVDLLKAAYDAIPRSPAARRMWALLAIPLRPDGIMRYELTHQLATFLVPGVLLWLFSQLWGGGLFWGAPTFLVWGLPVAVYVGYRLDKWYQKRLAWARRVAVSLDEGRYHAVQLISSRTVLKPEEFTFQVAVKMAREYEAFLHARYAEQQRKKAARAAQLAAASTYSASAAAESDDNQAAQWASGTTSNADEDFSGDDDGWTFNSVSNWGPDINPSNGFPMIPNSGVDVAGNPYGTGGI